MQIRTERICKIVLSLRNFSRLNEAEFKSVDIHKGIDSTLMILQHRLKVKKDLSEIQVIKHYRVLPHIKCYVGQINQVLMSLLNNAIDALEERDQHRTPEEIKQHPSTIVIRTEQLNNWVTICITDNGIGVSEEMRSRIFDPFFTTKPIGAGTGLGLSISYQIVTDQHNGQLTCHSTAESRTTFTIKIPLHQQKRALM